MYMGFCHFPHLVSRIHGGNLEKSTENVKIQGFQSKKYDATIRGNKCLSIPHPLLNLDLTGNEFAAMVKLWNWFQSPEVIKLKFITSRAHLAKLAGISEDTAKHTLQKLKRANALVGVSVSFGVTTYEWNPEFLAGGVTEIQSGGDCNSSGRWMKNNRPVDENHPASIICTLILPFYIPSYTALSRHSGTATGLRPSLGIIKDALSRGIPKETLKDALRAGLPIGKVVGLADAILSTWITADQGGSYFLHDIMLILNKFKVNLFDSENITGVLYSVLKNGENLHLARKQTPNFFDNDEALIAHYKQMEATHG